MDLFSHLDAVRDQAHMLMADRNQKLADLSAAHLLIAQLEAEIAELREQIPDPEPEPATPMRIGASVQRRGSETWAQALDRFEQSIGANVQCVRRFSSGKPSVTHSSFVDVIHGDVPALVLSWKDGTQAEVADFLDDLPAKPGRTYYVAHYHEPEDNMGGFQFRTISASLLAACRAVGRADIVPTFILKSWLERDGSEATSSAAYFPDEPAAWLMALDPYLKDDTRTYATQVGQTVALWRAYGGTRIGIAEFGVTSTGQTAADQITQFVHDARADGCEFCCYFDSNVGETGGWYLDLRGPEALAAYGALLA